MHVFHWGVYTFDGSIGKVPQVKLDRMVEWRGMHWWQSETVGGREYMQGTIRVWTFAIVCVSRYGWFDGEEITPTTVATT